MDNGACSYRRFLDGDDEAFNDIINEYRAPLTSFINRFVGDRALSEDIAIDVFAELVIHKHRYNFKTSLKTYIFMIGRSRALDCLRKRKRHAEISLCEVEEFLYDEDELDRDILAEERRRLVNRALSQLPEDMRMAVVLVYYENMSYKETAQVMKKSVKQVDNLLYRAKGILRNVIGEEGELLL